MDAQGQSIHAHESSVREELSLVGLSAELNLELGGTLFQKAYSVVSTYVTRNGLRSISNLSKLFPASTVLVISALAFEFGEGGEFWAKISEDSDAEFKLPFLNQQHQNEYGLAFRESLTKLELTNFSHVDGRRFLTPILLHAGLPVSSVGQVWKRLHEFVEKGYEDGAEIVSLWRQDESATQYFKIPAKRFIKESGRFAEDLIGRMVGVLVDVGGAKGNLKLDEICLENRVPKSLVQQLLSEDLSEIKRIKRVPPPKVVIDLLSGEGPQMLLPALDSNYSESSWRITSSETITYPASRHDDRYVELEPASRWSAELIRSGLRIKLREFRSVNSHTYWFFRQNSRFSELIDYSNALEDETTILIAPDGTNVKVKITGVETVVEKAENYLLLGGEWSRFALFELRLFGAEKLLLQNGESQSPLLEIPIIRAQGKPELCAQLATDVSDLEGRKTYSSIPRVRFTREVKNVEKYEVTIFSATDVICRCSIAELIQENEEYLLEDRVRWDAGSYRIRILGPLGSDLVESFVYMPNVRYQEPRNCYLPSGDVKTVLLIDGHRSAIMEFPDGEDRITAELELESEVLQFRLSIPRVLFSICELNETPYFGSAISDFTEDDFINEASKGNLYIRFRDSMKGKVQLSANGKIEYSTPFEIKVGEESTKIELARFRQDVIRSNSTTLELAVALEDAGSFTVAKIQTNFNGAISDMESNEVVDGLVTAVEFRIDKSLQKHQLQVVIIDKDQPWNGQQEILLDEANCKFSDNNDGTLTVLAKLSEPLIPSHYLTGLAFVGASKIIEASTHFAQIGSEFDLRRYLNTLPNDGFGLATGAIHGKHLPRRRVLSSSEYKDGVIAVGKYLLAHSDEDVSSGTYQPAIDFLLHDGRTVEFISWFCDVLSDKQLKPQAERLLISIFPRFCDSPLDNNDAAFRQRIWRTSPLIGTAMTYHLQEPEVVQERTHWLGELSYDKLPIEAYANTRLSELKKVSQLGFQNQKLVSSEFLKSAIINFILSNSSSERIEEIDRFNLGVNELVRNSADFQAENSNRLQQLKPSHMSSHRNSAVLRQVPYNMHQLGMLMVNSAVPYELANKAANLLSNQLKFGKNLVISSLLSALIETRVKTA